MSSNSIHQCAGATTQLNIPPKEEVEHQQSIMMLNNQQEEVKEIISTRKRIRPESMRRISFRAIRNDQKKKLIFLSRQVFDIIKSRKCIHGSEVSFDQYLDY